MVNILLKPGESVRIHGIDGPPSGLDRDAVVRFAENFLSEADNDEGYFAFADIDGEDTRIATSAKNAVVPTDLLELMRDALICSLCDFLRIPPEEDDK